MMPTQIRPHGTHSLTKDTHDVDYRWFTQHYILLLAHSRLLDIRHTHTYCTYVLYLAHTTLTHPSSVYCMCFSVESLLLYVLLL
jgi:hypothetical protein